MLRGPPYKYHHLWGLGFQHISLGGTQTLRPEHPLLHITPQSLTSVPCSCWAPCPQCPSPSPPLLGITFLLRRRCWLFQEVLLGFTVGEERCLFSVLPHCLYRQFYLLTPKTVYFCVSLSCSLEAPWRQALCLFIPSCFFERQFMS